MAITGKTGADAISKDLKHSVRMISKFTLKLNSVVAAARTAGAITVAQETDILAFISIAPAASAAFEALAAYSGF